MTQPHRRRADRPVQPPRRGPAEHQLRRRQHLRQGHRDRPGHRRARRAAVGQGLRRRPRHADRGGPGGAAAGPAARAGRRLPGRRPRGRDGRRVRLLPARQGRRRAVDRHRHARAGRRRARRPPAPGLRHRDRDRRRRRGADRGDLRRQGRVGAVAAARVPARPGHRRDQGSRTRRPIGCILGGHGITAWGDTIGGVRGATRCGSSDTAEALHRRARQGRAVRPGRSPATRPLPEDERRARAAALAPTIRAHRLDGPAAGRPLHRLRRRAGLPGRAPSTRGWPRWAPPARTTSCAPRSSRWSSTCPPTAPVEEAIARLRELHAAYREDYQAYYDRNATPGQSPAIRGADPAIVLVPGVGMFCFGKDKQTARVAGEFYVNAINVMRGAEASRRTPRSTRRRSSASSTGRWRRPSCSGCRSPSRWPPGSRWSPAPPPASARRSPTGSPPRAPAWSIADLDLEKAQAAAAEIGGADVAVGVQVDVTDEAAVGGRVDAAVLAFGGVDLVVNNAGLSISKPLLETTVADWDLQHDVMAKGSFLVSARPPRR